VGIESAIERLPVTRASRTAQLTVIVYLVVLVLAQASASIFSIEVSVACNSALLLVLLNHFVFAASAEVRPALVGLALVPLLRIEAIALPQPFIPSDYWEALPMALVMLTVVGLRRVADPSGQIGLRSQRSERAWPAQLAMSLAGPAMSLIGVSFAVAAVFAGSSVSALHLNSARPSLVSTPATVLLVAAFSGVTLEIVFRGVVQPTLIALCGWHGITLTSLLYAGLFVGAGSSWLFVVLAFVTGFVWGAFSARTGRVSGVAGSHALYAMTWAALF
jgi:membrane protease YdiL (CAAX protease family)